MAALWQFPWQVIFRVSMGIFKQIEQQVMACQSFDVLMERAKAWPRCMVQHNELLKASFQGQGATGRFLGTGSTVRPWVTEHRHAHSKAWEIMTFWGCAMVCSVIRT